MVGSQETKWVFPTICESPYFDRVRVGVGDGVQVTSTKVGANPIDQVRSRWREVFDISHSTAVYDEGSRLGAEEQTSLPSVTTGSPSMFPSSPFIPSSLCLSTYLPPGPIHSTPFRKRHMN